MKLEPEPRSVDLLYAGPDPERGETVAGQLRARGLECAVARAETTDELSRELERRSFSVVVVGDRIDGGDGLAALARCRETQPSAMAVLLAADPSPELVDRAHDAGVDEFVHDSGEAALRQVGHRIEAAVDDGALAGDPGGGRQVETFAETMSDAVVSIDESSTVRYANPAVEDVFGYEPSEIVGEPLTRLMSGDLADDHLEGIRRYVRTGERTLDWDYVELPGRHRDGHEIPLSISFSEFSRGSTRYFTGVIRDVSKRRRLEAEWELYHDATQRILRAESFSDGLRAALEAIGPTMNWQYGEAWSHAEGDHLERVADSYAASESAAAFEAATSPLAFERGEGLVGRVWESGSCEWLEDVTSADARFERAAAAERANLGAALAVPIASGGTVVAVLVFLTAESREPDEAMIEATRSIAADLGHLMKRLDAETAVRRERGLSDRVLETSPVGIVIAERDGTLRYVNDRASDLLDLGEFEGPIEYDDVAAEALAFEGEPVTGASRPYHRVIEDGEAISGETKAEIDGEVRWFAVDGAPMRDESGAVTSAVFALEDVTARKERERQLGRYEAVMQTIDDGVYALDDDERFVFVNDAYADLLGYDRSDLLGEPVDQFLGERVAEEAGELQATMRRDGSEATTLEATLATADGGQVPVEARIVVFDLDDGRTGRAGVVRDISERKRREERLAQLNEIGRALTTAETREEVADVIVDGAREALGLPLTTLEYYDESAGRLRTGRRTAELRDLLGDSPVFESAQDLPWEAFAASEERVVSDLGGETDVDDAATPLESALVFPVGTHGAFIAGATESNAFSDADVQVARILVANALAALDRVDRERELREKRAELREHTESLERINRLNGVIRSLTRKLVDASTREEIEAAVCEQLTAAEPYVFAWVGEQRAATDEIEPRAHAGREEGYLDAITVTAADGETAGGPAGRAMQTLEPAVQNNLQSDPPFEPWRTQALRRDYRASVSVPLTYRNTLYGLLNLYADETGIFDEMEVAVLRELGEMVGYAINAIERKKALVSDAAVELAFSLDDRSVPAMQFAAEVDAEFEFDTLVEQSDGRIRAFFAVSGADPETVYEFCDRAPAIHQISLLSEADDEHRYEAVVSESGFLGELVSYGAHPTEMSATPTGGRVTVELPRSGDVRSFVRMFTREYDGAELLRRKKRERSVQTREEFEASYRERLTERQREVLETAYFSGFFEWPREVSGEELASKLGVTQPTVSRHVRTGERKLFDVVFDDE
ncbi:MAG: PAS domain S-box protein [Halosimplex sp.]